MKLNIMPNYLLAFLIAPICLFSQVDESKNKEVENEEIEQVVYTGTMKEVSKSKSAVPVEIYTAKFFEKNPTPSLIESIGRVNGIRPQINCSVCSTGDIHINGLEGPYTIILIDGMPIVSSLSTVYGLNGIPNSMVDRIEVVKGPGSSLYGSEAMAGIINVITKNSLKAPKLSADFNASSWGEYNTDLAVKYNLGNNISSILSLNYFNFEERKDKNNDNFIDGTLQDRLSIFNKYDFKRKDKRQASFAVRYLYEDRLGGELEYDKHEHRGGTAIYGESIYTNRVELIGRYQLPTTEKIFTQFSFNYHRQDSFYGNIAYKANQKVAFGQVYWDKKVNNHDVLVGTSINYNYYDDNTPGTLSFNGAENKASKNLTNGIFIQNEIKLDQENTLLMGYRLDYNENHGFVHSPRLAYKMSPNKTTQIRASFGTGFRIVNLFTEDHAALTGSREVIIKNDLDPEKSYNGTINATKKIKTDNNTILDLDASLFYTYFTNKIIGDFETNPNQIIFDNLEGHSISKGVSLNTNIKFSSPLRLNLGVTYMQVYENINGKKTTQLFAPEWSGKYTVSYSFPKHFSADLTGEVYGPMKLPIVTNDFRSENSPWYQIANITLRKKWDDFEVYGGVKNLFDFTPENPLYKSDAPFSQEFDTAYGYAPMIGTHAFLGINYNIK